MFEITIEIAEMRKYLSGKWRFQSSYIIIDQNKLFIYTFYMFKGGGHFGIRFRSFCAERHLTRIIYACAYYNIPPRRSALFSLSLSLSISRLVWIYYCLLAAAAPRPSGENGICNYNNIPDVPGIKRFLSVWLSASLFDPSLTHSLSLPLSVSRSHSPSSLTVSQSPSLSQGYPRSLVRINFHEMFNTKKS